ncbi:MAG: hypothetical protein NT144_13385 [Bacteroidia bacterium]|nr:hypothetical protein [Bacteroidia bacterium]
MRKDKVVKSGTFLLNGQLILFLLFLVNFLGCKKEEEVFYPESDRSIQITDDIVIDNGVKLTKPIFNYSYYDNFLSYLSASDHFLIVSLKDFKNTTSEDKVVLSLRYDIDENINAAVKLAYREHKYGIKSTYFVLHTATYYGQKIGPCFKRNDNIIFYLKKLQDDFGHEIGFHNDLVTLQLMYEIPPKEYLKNELAYLRENNIHIWGTTYHGSQYCYIYKYYNAYFWKEYPDNGWNYEYITKGYKTLKIEKDSLKTYNFTYEGGLLNEDYFFADCFFIDGKRWNMSMVNLDTIKPGKKVIILLHPANWD